jgi:hypothetical protein
VVSISRLARERELHGGSVNLDYLKRVVLGYLTATSAQESATLLSVLVGG